MAVEPGSKQNGVVNMTRAMEALSPWLSHPRKTIIKVEALVVAAAMLLLLQLILGSCKRRWHNSFLKYGLQACNGIMFPLIIYTLGTMQSSPIKNSSYPVWAGFLIMASSGTITVWQYDFFDSLYKKLMHVLGEISRDLFYVIMFILLVDPSPDPDSWNKVTMKIGRASSQCVIALVTVVLLTKIVESISLASFGYDKEKSLFSIMKKSTQDEDRMGQTTNDLESDTDPLSMKNYEYAVCIRQRRFITIDHIWDSCANSADGKALKDLCLSFTFFWRLVGQRYFGVFYPDASHLEAQNFFFEKLLPSEGDFKRAFRIIEAELLFCYDFFFTKYPCTFLWTNWTVPFFQSLILLKMVLISIVGVLAIRKSLVLETPSPIIEVQISESDYIITLLVLSIALIVEIVQAAFYLASNWAQVSLACMHVKKQWFEPNVFIFGKVISFLRRVTISGKLRRKIDQHSVIFQQKQLDSVEVSDAVKRAIARSLISTYGNNLTTNGETSVRLHHHMSNEYTWAFKDLSLLELMLIWHIATEYCDISSDPSSDRSARGSNHRGAHLFGYVLQLLRPNPIRNRIASDGHRGVAVHVSRYCIYLMRSVPELLPYHEADIAELKVEVMKDCKEFFGSYSRISDVYNKMMTQEEEDYPRKIFKKGVKLGKQLQRIPDEDRWEVLQDFWAQTIIHAAASHHTTMQHMLHLENGAEFLTHIWALLSHAGILSLNRGKGQEDQGNLGSDPSAAV